MTKTPEKQLKEIKVSLRSASNIVEGLEEKDPSVNELLSAARQAEQAAGDLRYLAGVVDQLKRPMEIKE